MFIIAEIAQAHEGSLGIAHSYIDALAQTGVDAVKFQTYCRGWAAFTNPSGLSSVMKMPPGMITEADGIHARTMGQAEIALRRKRYEFISSPFNMAACCLAGKTGSKKYKIGSGEVSNLLMLEKLRRYRWDIILSSGMSSLAELDNTISFLKPFGNRLSVMQCKQPIQQWLGNGDWMCLPVLKQRYQLPTGFSDHSGDIFHAWQLQLWGAELLEFHVVFDKSDVRPWCKSLLTIEQVKKLVQGVNEITNRPQNKSQQRIQWRFAELKNIPEITGVEWRLDKGHVISFTTSEAKKNLPVTVSMRWF